MEPDGWVRITYAHPIQDELQTKKYLFKDIVWWKRDEAGITVKLDEHWFIFYPAVWVLFVEWQVNSVEYQEWKKLQEILDGRVN